MELKRNHCGGPCPCLAIAKVVAVIITELALDILESMLVCRCVSGTFGLGMKVTGRLLLCVWVSHHCLIVSESLGIVGLSFLSSVRCQDWSLSPFHLFSAHILEGELCLRKVS